MKGIVLAGGTGSRLFPLTKCVNKHLLPVGTKPMIFYAIEKLVESGIKDIMVVTGIEHAGTVIQALGSGKDFGCELTYRVQDEAGGIAQALMLCKNFVKQDKVCVILGDNIFDISLKEHVYYYNNLQESCAMVLLKEVKDPTRYGVAEIKDNKVVGIVEKPVDPKSNYAVTGIYFYDQNVWDIVKMLVPSGRGELEITDVNNYYRECFTLYYQILTGFWSDCGTFESLQRTNRVLDGLYNS